MAGLHREVFLYSTADVHLGDVAVTAELDEDLATGLLQVDVRVGGGPEAGWRLEATVVDDSGASMFGRPLGAPVPVFDRSDPTAETISAYVHWGTVRIRERFADVTPLSYANPVLHTLVRALVDPDRSVVDDHAVTI